MLFQDACRSEGTDVRLFCSNGVEVGGHKVILVITSGIFLDLLSHAQSNLILVPFSSDVVEKTLEILYCGEASVTIDEAEQVDKMLGFFHVPVQVVNVDEKALDYVLIHIPRGLREAEEKVDKMSTRFMRRRNGCSNLTNPLLNTRGGSA